MYMCVYTDVRISLHSSTSSLIGAALAAWVLSASAAVRVLVRVSKALGELYGSDRMFSMFKPKPQGRNTPEQHSTASHYG
eukprot:scaffold117197_cov25-Prasinocladus_malaysianus.AAC.1